MMQTIIADVLAVFSGLCSGVATVTSTIFAQGNEILLYALCVGFAGIIIHYFKMLLRA